MAFKMAGWSPFTKDDKQTATNPNKDKKVTNQPDKESDTPPKRVKKKDVLLREASPKAVEKRASGKQEDPRYSGPPIKVHGAGTPTVPGSVPQYAMPVKFKTVKPLPEDKK